MARKNNKITIFILLAIIAGFLFLLLARWQYNRGIYKLNLETQLKNNLALPAVNLNNSNQEINNLERFTKVTATGKFIKPVYFIDNQIFNKQLGYSIISAFKLKNTNKIIFINRGWINKNHINNLPMLNNIININGYIYTPPQGLNLFNKNVNTSELNPIITLSESSPGVLTSNIKFSTGLPSMKHFGYAIQWGLLALLSFFYPVFILWQRS